MKKRIVLAAALVLLAFVLCGCGTEEAGSKTFIAHERYSTGTVLIDTETGVMYWMAHAGRSEGALTLLVDANGMPKVYQWEGR